MRSPLATLARASLLLALAGLPLLQAQTPSEDPAERPAPRFTTPPDLNGNRVAVPPPDATRPLRIGIYRGPGSGEGNVLPVEKHLQPVKDFRVTRLPPESFASMDLSARFDVLIFAGGTARAQANAIGPEGREAVREFVRKGGGYLGICAGAYLACSGFDWGLAILDARTVSPKWQRGRANLEVSPTPSATRLLGLAEDGFKLRYVNGPVIRPDGHAHLPDYEPVLLFRTETAENDSPVGAQIGTPAMALSTFGSGRVFFSSAHPESTPGFEHFLTRAVLWLAPPASP
jgi:putative intracellular protease/amidase